MNTDNTVTFRLPDASLRELNRLCAESGKSRGLIAKEIVMAELAHFSRFDEMAFRLTLIERQLASLAESDAAPASTNQAANELRGMLATATFQALVQFGRLSEQDAAQFVQNAFGVREESGNE